MHEKGHFSYKCGLCLSSATNLSRFIWNNNHQFKTLCIHFPYKKGNFFAYYICIITISKIYKTNIYIDRVDNTDSLLFYLNYISLYLSVVVFFISSALLSVESIFPNSWQHPNVYMCIYVCVCEWAGHFTIVNDDYYVNNKNISFLWICWKLSGVFLRKY